MFNNKPYHFSKKSASNLDSCHEDLQNILKDVIKYIDLSVICGSRGKLEQDKAFALGKSKVKYPNSKHNNNPSLAVDIVPCPLDWNDLVSFEVLIRFIQGYSLGKYNIRLRAGIDFNSNWKQDDSFVDAPHLELHSKLIEGHWVKYE